MKRASPSRFSKQRGFTLLEMLIATAAGAVVLIVIQTTFFGALRLHNTTHERIDEDLALQRALSIIRRDFAGLMLPGGTLSGQLQTSNFSSLGSGSYGERVTPDLFTSSGRIDGWSPFAEVQMVAYYLAPASGGPGSDLLRVVTRNLLPLEESAVEPEVVLHGVAAASVLFYDGMGWTEAWDSTATNSVPTGIKLSLVMRSADSAQNAPAPVELVVPISVATSSQAQAAEEGGP